MMEHKLFQQTRFEVEQNLPLITLTHVFKLGIVQNLMQNRLNSLNFRANAGNGRQK